MEILNQSSHSCFKSAFSKPNWTGLGLGLGLVCLPLWKSTSEICISYQNQRKTAISTCVCFLYSACLITEASYRKRHGMASFPSLFSCHSMDPPKVVVKQAATEKKKNSWIKGPMISLLLNDGALPTPSCTRLLLLCAY